jgi:outer membrane protein assembly factor BamA
MRYLDFRKLAFSAFLTLFVVLAFSTHFAKGQSESWDAARQDRKVSSLIKRAEQDQFMVRRLEFSGNKNIRDRVLRRETNNRLKEGDIFTRKNLVQSLKDLSKLKVIHPVLLKDVEVYMDDASKDIDLVFNIRERPRSK